MNKPKILIVENNIVCRKELYTCLDSAGYSVVESADAASALDAAKSTKFDLIIQNLTLPDMDGLTLSQRLRTIPDITDIPIFATSGLLNLATIQATNNSFAMIMLKPIDSLYLLDVVKTYLPISNESTQTVKKSKHVLIADDNPIQLKLFTLQLKNAGFEVSQALDGAIAFKEALRNPPDIIVSDIIMPHMDGFDLCVEIKKDPNLCKIPVILLTSNTLEEEDLKLAKWVKASSYLTRTPNEATLINAIHTALHTNFAEQIDGPIELTNEVKEEHTFRSIRQLEQQVSDNTKLSQHHALLMTQKSLIDVVVNSLTNNRATMDEAIQQLLHICLEATGISKGALYVMQADQSLKLVNQLGYSVEQNDMVAEFFGLRQVMTDIIKDTKPLALPSNDLSAEISSKFLATAEVKSAFIVPLFAASDAKCLGVMLFGSNQINLAEANTTELVSILGKQVAQSLALISAFNSLFANVPIPKS